MTTLPRRKSTGVCAAAKEPPAAAPDKSVLHRRFPYAIGVDDPTEALSHVFAEWDLVAVDEPPTTAPGQVRGIGADHTLYGFVRPDQVMVMLLATRTSAGSDWSKTHRVTRLAALDEAVGMLTVSAPTFLDTAQTVARWVRYGINADWWAHRVPQILAIARVGADEETLSQIDLLAGLGAFDEAKRGR